MAEKKSLVEEALTQMKNLEDIVAENAKGILASTMKGEISELVKESLKETESDSEEMDEESTSKMSFDEQDEDDEEVEDEEMDDTDDNLSIDDEDEDTDIDTEVDTDIDMDMDTDDEEPVDLRGIEDDEDLLTVFKAMGPNDTIQVVKDGSDIRFKDGENEYLIKMNESEEDESMEMDEEIDLTGFESDDDDFEEIDMTSDDMGSEDMGSEDMSFDMGSDDDELMFEIEMDDEEESEEDESEEDESMEMDESEEDDEEVMYEIETDESDEMDEDWTESTDLNSPKMMAHEGFKPKGVGMGKAKFQYKKSKGGFKETVKKGTKGVGMGKPKFEYKESSKMKMEKPTVKKGGETSEASRTLGAGRRFGKKGLPKPKAAPQHLNVESVNNELSLLRAKNEEYRKALNVFRDKLNEVAVFNSNLAYATRLFTEHSTTKQEKINVLRRFDSVQSLKESKTLYRTIKDELSSQGTAKVVKESLQEKMERTPSSGSAVNLIESKTYENPQFLRMKDLMTKMNVVK